MGNLEIYEKYRNVPNSAKRNIAAGRLKGKTDINPMWRIKSLTEAFGVCGVGWYIETIGKWLDNGANGEIISNVEINLYVKIGGEWSKPIYGIGGSKAVVKETNGTYTDDDCFKKAYTDAISVACKALGFGADVYYESDCTKYNQSNNDNQDKPKQADKPIICPKCGKVVKPVKIDGVPYYPDKQLKKFGMCAICFRSEKVKSNEQADVQT